MTSQSTLPFLFAVKAPVRLKVLRVLTRMCQNHHLSHPESTDPHHRRTAYQILLPAVYDHTTLAVNIKNKHMGSTEGAGAGEEKQA